MIELGDIKDMTKITLQEGDVLVARVARDDMPGYLFQKHCLNLRDTLKTYFLSNEILVLPDDVSLAVINKGTYNGTPTNP
jgi:hypothetical protein